MDNKSAIITGASRGIGKAIAIQLAKDGYNVAISYQNSGESAKEVQKECEEFGVKAIIVKGDLSLEKDCENLINAAMSEFGRVDILVNNAGITKDNLILKMNIDDFMEVIQTNLVSAFNCSRFASKIMVRQRSGKIINISSVSGLYGNAGQANYSSAKAGLIGLTKTLAKELSKRNITVNAIAPGFINTDMVGKFPKEFIDEVSKKIPLGKIGNTQDIAKTVSFLANSDYITGQVIVVDGGLSLG